MQGSLVYWRASGLLRSSHATNLLGKGSCWRTGVAYPNTMLYALLEIDASAY